MLILATERRLYTVVLAEAVEQELQRNIALTLAAAAEDVQSAVAAQVDGWPRRVRVERQSLPDYAGCAH